MALGDAMAVALLEVRGFTEEDFALFHPGGALGRRLLSVGDVMHTGDDIPKVSYDVPVREAIFEITSKKLGFTTVVDARDHLVGVITDGDLRRLMERETEPLTQTATKVMTRNPKIISKESLAAKALQIMETHSITSLVVGEGPGRIEGVIHLHDILKAGVA